MKKFEEFQMPDDSVIQCYARKYKSYHKDNIPFYEYVPTEEELLVNSRICEQKMREKEAAKAEAQRRRAEKRKENASRRKRANDENLNLPDVPEEVPEEIAQDYIDELIEDLAGQDDELDAMIGGFFFNKIKQKMKFYLKKFKNNQNEGKENVDLLAKFETNSIFEKIFI